ncbi:MAG: hypothetical protein IT336_07815 [Thermomicrobiales bacterium]|nr:hypothetical protein [Thermomicrobiales bacterium]
MLEKISSHQDLWWAIGMNRYPSDRMPALEQTFSAQIDVFAYDQVILIHPASTINASDRIATVEAFLARAIQATEPFEGKKSSYYAPLRMGLANVILLKCGSNAPAQSIVDLIGPYTVEASVDDVVSGVRAQERMAQGDIAGARALAVRLIGLVPGNANMYGYMAVVEAAGGHATAAGYRAAEAALRSGLTPATTYDFPSCD